ncbi:MAG: flagellar hook-basal body complex protein FliE [bacterium]|nr:flagellar hook-basal body complex protein FliE [bacterium]
MDIFSAKGVSFPNAYPKVIGSQARVDLPMQTSDARHMQPGSTPTNPERVTEGFAAALGEALGRVESLDVRSQDLTARAVYEPDSVEAHEVVLAAEKARFALNLTKTVTDGLIRGYQSLTNPR